MKKTLILMASLVTFFTASGCSGSNDSGNASEKTDKIVFSYWGDESENKAITQVVDAFREENPEIEVETQWIQKDYLTKMQVQIAGNTASDVYLISGGDLPGFANNFIEQNIEKDLYIDESVIKPMEYEGKAKAKPFIIKPSVMAINKDLFKKNNLDLPSSSEAMSTEDFENIVENLTDASAEPSIYGTEPVYFDPWVYSFESSLYKNDGTESNMDSEEVIATAEYLIGLKNKKVFPPSEESEGQSMIEWFLSGRIGIYANFNTWNLPPMRDVKGFDWDIVPFVNGGGSKEVNGLAISQTSKQVENSQKFIDFLCDSPEAQKIIGANQNAYGVPVLAEVVDSFTTIYEDKNLQAFVNAAYHQTPQETQKNTNEILSVKNTSLQSTKLKNGEKEPADVFPKLAEEITGIIQGN